MPLWSTKDRKKRDPVTEESAETDRRRQKDEELVGGRGESRDVSVRF